DAGQIGALGFDAVRYETAERTVTLGAAGALPSTPIILDPSKPVIELIDDAAGARVVLNRALARGVAVARFDRQYLLDAAALARGDLETCVFARSLHGAPIFCTDSTLAAAASRHSDDEASSGTFTTELNGEPWLAGYWQLFIPSRFTGEPWLMV